MGRYGTADSCKAVLGVFPFDAVASLSFVISVFMVVDDTPLHDISFVLLAGKVIPPSFGFRWEAIENCGDTLYIRKRKSYAWMKWYGKKTLPLSDWDD